MTKKEFIKRYAARSRVSVDFILQRMSACPCDCKEDNCKGWQMLTPDGVVVQEELGRISK